MNKRIIISGVVLGIAAAAIGVWAVVAASRRAAQVDPELFRIGPEDEGRISRQFVARMRAEVGDERASCASAELDAAAWRFIGRARTRIEIEDAKCDYCNYLDRLYAKARAAAAKELSPAELAEFLRQEQEWRKRTDESYACDLRYEEDDFPLLAVNVRTRYIRNLRNRTRYLESSRERRAELARFDGLRVNYVLGELPVEFHELRRKVPLDAVHDDRRTRGKFFFDELATLPPEFCREVKVGADLYQLAVLIPNDDISGERSTQGYERILVVWKNREHFATYYLPDHAVVSKLDVRGTEVSIRYRQNDDVDRIERSDRRADAEQTYTVDFTYRIYAPVRITNWLNYYMDGLGNIHRHGCCRGRFGNQEVFND